MSLACLQRLNCCRSTDEETGKRPEIVVISTQPDKDNASIPESFGDSGVSLRGHGKYTKAGSRGSVSEEDSGVGSEGHNQSDIADQTDTSSQADESQPGTLRRSDSNLSEFGNILPICENQDLTAEIAEELKMMNGFSLEANTKRNILELDLAGDNQMDTTEKKKKRKRRKHRKVNKEQLDDQESEEVKEV